MFQTTNQVCIYYVEHCLGNDVQNVWNRNQPDP